jgi:hypothetical protein
MAHRFEGEGALLASSPWVPAVILMDPQVPQAPVGQRVRLDREAPAVRQDRASREDLVVRQAPLIRWVRAVLRVPEDQQVRSFVSPRRGSRTRR